MMVQELKTDPAVFRDIFEDRKKFEIRKNDRGFAIGDELHLRETKHTGAEMREGAPLEYTGRSIPVEVTHIMHGPKYGLAEGWCIMSIAKV